MEDLVTLGFWRGKRVFLTGHTGFKGSWLALWLHRLGAKVSGFALAPPTDPSLYEAASIGDLLASTIGDIRDPAALEAALAAADPEIIFHLAAQPLVAEGYADPVGTYATNVLGTVNLLQGARRLKNLRAMVVITSDKCYENREMPTPYRETDPLGGYDPYSSSKACTELAVASWRNSFFDQAGSAAIATARAGNVIGGGDWAPQRLVPDILRAFSAGEPARLRHPGSVRPWQHVLEPLAGYLRLAERLWTNRNAGRAWNFAPRLADCLSVGAVADRLVSLWPGPARWLAEDQPATPHEAGILRLDASAAEQQLGWHPRWPLDQALGQTVAWHQAWLAGEDMQAFSLGQIDHYLQDVGSAHEH